MSQALTQFSTQVKDTTSQFSAINKIGAAFVGFGGAIATGLGVAMAVSMEYENLIQRFATTSRASGAEVTQIHDRLLTLSAGMATSAEGLARLAVGAGRLGLSAAGVEKFVLAGAKLETISGGAITGEAAVERIARIANIFKVDLAGSADKIASTFVGLARATTATESEIAAVVTRTAELGKELGFTIPQMAALAATAKDLGLEPRRAAGAIETLFQSMTRHDNMRAFARQIKMTGYEFRQHLGKDPLTIIERLRGSFRGLNSVMIENKLKKMGITDAAARSLVLGLANNIDKLNKNLRVADEAFTKGTAANEAYQEMLGSTKMTLAVFLNGLHAVAVAFGEILLPPLKLALNVGIWFLQFLLAIPKPIKVVMVVMSVLVAGLLMLVGGAILAGVALYVLSRSFAAVQKQMGWLLLTNQGLIVAMQETVVAAILESAVFLETLIPSLTATIDELALLMGEFVLGEIGLGEFAGGLYGVVAAAVSLEMLTGIGEILLVVAAAAAVSYVVFKALEPTFTQLYNSIMLLGEPFRVLSDGVSEIAGMFGTSGGGLGSVLMTFVRIGLLPIIIQIKSIAWGFQILASFLTGTARAFIALAKPIIEPFARLYNFIMSVLAPIVDAIDSFAGAGSTAVSVFGGLASVAEFAFTYLSPIGLMFRMIGDAVQLAAFMIESVLGGAWKALGDDVEGSGFLTEMHGLLLDVGTAFSEVGDAINDVIQPFRLLLTEWGLLSEGGGLLHKIVQGIGTAIGWVVQVFLWPFVTGLRIMGALVGFIAKAIAFELKYVVKAIELIVWPLKKAFELVTAIAAAVGGLLSKNEPVVDAVAPAVTKPVVSEEAVEKAMPVSVRNRNRATVAERKAPMFFKQGLIHENDPIREHTESRVYPTFRPETHEVARDRGNNERMLGAMRAAVNAALAVRSAEHKSSGGGGAVTINIPVTVMLDDMELGHAVAQVSDEQVRRAFGAKNIRLSGVS